MTHKRSVRKKVRKILRIDIDRMFVYRHKLFARGSYYNYRHLTLFISLFFNCSQDKHKKKKQKVQDINDKCDSFTDSRTSDENHNNESKEETKGEYLAK